MAAGEHASLSDATLWVYPTALKVRAVLHRRIRGGDVVLGLGATTFPELVDRLAADLGIAADVLPPALARVVLHHVLGREGSPLADRRGLVRESYDAIEALEAAGLDAAAVREIATRLGPGEAGVRLGEVAAAYAAYEKALARLGVVDRHKHAVAVADELAAYVEEGRRPPALAGVGRLVFSEIYDYSVLQFLIATSLIRLVGDAELVAFAHPENVGATRFLDRTWNRFVGTEPIADQVLPSFVRRDGREGSINAVLRGLFAPDSPPPAVPDGRVRLIVAPHRYGEVEAVLRDVRRRLSAGVPPDRIAVLARDLTPYRDLLADVARRFRVPLHFRQGPSLLGASVVRYVLELWRTAADDFPRERLASLLDSDYVHGRFGRIRRLLTQIGYVSEQVAPLEKCLERAVASATERKGKAPRARAQAAVRRAMGVLRPLGARRTVAGHVRVLRGVLRRLGFKPVGREGELPDEAARDARASAGLDDVLAELAALDRALGGDGLDPREMAERVADVLSDWPAESSVGEPGGVRALSVQDARGLDFAVVYVLGLDDGTFPAPRRESVLLPDWLRQTVNPVAAEVLRARLGRRAEGLPLGALLRTAREANLEDPFLFFLACSMAEQEIVLAYPASDGEGTPAIRSPFVDAVEGCFADELPTMTVSPATLVPPAPECAEVRELVVRATTDRWREAGAAGRRLASALAAGLPGASDRLASIDRRVHIERSRERYFLTPGAAGEARAGLADATVGRVDADAGVREAIAERHWSASSIERLAACGFKFFARDLLRLGEPEDPSADVAPRERGLLLHQALEEVFRRFPTLPPDLTAARSEIAGFLAQQRDALLARLPPKELGLALLGWQRVVRAVDEIICLEHRRWGVDVAGAEHVGHVEWEFDLTLEDETDAAPLSLRGRADRVDLWRAVDGAVSLHVTDYKSARDRRLLVPLLKPGGELGRTAFQVPLYLDAARRLLVSEADEVTLHGRLVAALAPVRDKEVAAELDADTLSDVRRRLRALVVSAEAGHFDVDPVDCDRWCPYRGVCRYQPPPVEDEPGA